MPLDRSTARGQAETGPLAVPSVDAPLQARENFRIVAARSRMLPSVRPSMRQGDSRWPVWEFADRVQITWACLKHGGTDWVSRPRLADCCAIRSFRSPLRRRGRGQPRLPRPELCTCHL